MDDKRRNEIRQIVDRFNGQPTTQNVVNEFCQLHGFETVMVGELSDYTAQVNHDIMVGKLFPQILEEIQKLRYVPEYASTAERRVISDMNEEVRVSITKLLEQHEVKYIFVSHLSTDLGNMIAETVKGAGVTAFNKAIEVMGHIATTKFGGTMHMGHVAKYVEEVFNKAEVDNKAKSEQDNGNEEPILPKRPKGKKS